jgi:hypothetical protein
MKRLFLILLLTTATALAQDKKAEPDYNTTREFKNKIFEIKNRDPRVVAQSVRLLGSGFKGADLSVSTELKTISVRDFPENIATIEEAIKRLDQPVAEGPDIEMKISVLIGSKAPLTTNTASIPDDLEPVIKQLQSTLRYSHYGLMTATVQRTKPGHGIEGSGVAEPAILGMTVREDRPIFYSYSFSQISLGPSSARPTIEIENVNFSMRVPVAVSNGTVQYQNVGFQTPVSLREKEKVVLGTTTMGDKAVIVVVTATAAPKETP